MKFNELFDLIDNSEYTKSGADVDWTIKVIDDTVYLLFQETTNKIDWKTNFKFWVKPYKHQKNPMLLHAGFVNAWKSCNDLIMGELIQVMNFNKGKKLIISGWSHGAALTILAAEDYHYRTGERPVVINYGAPSIIAPLAFRTKKYLSECMDYRLFSDVNDLVTKIPPFYMSLKRTKLDKFVFGGIFHPNIYHCIYNKEELYKEQ